MNALRVLATMSAVLLASQLAPPGLASAQPRDERQIIAGLSVRWQVALAGAFREFAQERNPRPDCFSIYAAEQGDALLVNFTPGRPLPQDRHLRGGSTSCGRDVSFLMSRDGVLLRRTYSR